MRVRVTRGLSLAPLLLGACSGEPERFARAHPITSLDQVVGGPKGVVRPGDLILENDRFRVGILSARNSLGPGLYGGSIVDADIRRSDPAHAGGRGMDQFAELFPTVNMNVPEPGRVREDGTVQGYVEIVQEGSASEPAIVRVDGPGVPFLTLLDALWALVDSPDVWITTDYIAEPGVPWVTIKTRATFGYDGVGELPPSEPIPYFDEGLPLLDWALETGAVMGEFYLSGGSVDVFAPGIGFDEDGAVFRAMSAGDNTFVEPFRYDFIAGVADGVSYGIAPIDGAIYVPLFTASQTVAVGGGTDGDGTKARFGPGTSFEYERMFFIGHGDVGSIVDQYVEARGIPAGRVSGHVLEQTTGAALSGVDVFVFEPEADQPWSQWLTDVDPDDDTRDGSFGGQLPVGTWELLVHQRGRPDGARVPVTVVEGREVTVHLEARRSGVLDFTVRDEVGRLVPAKVTLFRLDDAPTRRPELGDGFIGGAPESVVFAAYGQGQVELAPGRYQAQASRGLEYEIDTSAPFVIGEQSGADLELTVVRSVDTPDWISADLHVHAVPSHDSGVLLADRVRTMVTEGVEFFASTDHDYLVDYAPTVELLGLEQWVQTAVGNEITTVEIGHFLGFPLGQDFQGEAGADRDRVDWTGLKPADLFGNLRSLGQDVGASPAVFVGHPRDGILGYFDQYGFDPYGGFPGFAGQPGQPEVSQPTLSLTNPLLASSQITWDFDGLELLNGKRFELLRTPLQSEMDRREAGEDVPVYELFSRTADEQRALDEGDARLTGALEGQLDDWFTLLNLGFRYTVLGNSDTHGLTSTEAGCPRNFVYSPGNDDPALLDDQAIADAVKAHHVVASYGPFVELTANGEIVGSELRGDGPVKLGLRVQAPSWVAVDRIELYENGVLLQEIAVPATDDVVRYDDELEVQPTRDSWYVVIVMGDGDLAPVFSPVEIPYVELQMVVTEALGGIEAVAGLLDPAPALPRIYHVYPFAVTNPIWVDLAGDGFDAPGLPPFMAAGPAEGS